MDANCDTKTTLAKDTDTMNCDTETTLAGDTDTIQKRARVEQPAIPTTSKTTVVATPSPAPSHIFSPNVSDQDRGTHAAVMERLIDAKNHFQVNGTTYLSLEQIGSGGSSKVFRVLGPDMRTYALKYIKMKKTDATSIARYENEIKLLKSLQGSPYVIKLMDDEMNFREEVLYVVMEIGEIDLMSKLKQLKENRIVVEENFLRLVWFQMLQAVNYIHTNSIIHGDLKPANFLFVNGAIKLIDFGIAKAIPDDTTNVIFEQAEGTVNYMAPEVAASSLGRNKTPQKVGRAGDIWSLGCILYLIVYGSTPFPMEEHIVTTLIKIADANNKINFPPLRSNQLADVLQSCLRWHPKFRPTIHGLLEHPFLNPDRVVDEPDQLGHSPGSPHEAVCLSIQKANALLGAYGYSLEIETDMTNLVDTYKAAKKASKK